MFRGGRKTPYSFHMEGENILEKERGGSRLEKEKVSSCWILGVQVVIVVVSPTKFVPSL